jgi:hypothetical protein
MTTKMRNVHSYKGYKVIPGTRGWAVSWVVHHVPTILQVKLGLAEQTVEHKAEFFKTLNEAKAKIEKLVAGEEDV